MLAYELWFWFYPSLPPFIQPSTCFLPLHRHGVVVASGLQDVPAPLGEPQGVLRGSAGEPLAQNDVAVAPEAP